MEINIVTPKQITKEASNYTLEVSDMKKSVKIVIFFIIIIFVGISSVFVFAEKYVEGKNEFHSIGSATGTPIKLFMEEINSKDTDIEYIGVIEGVQISKNYYDIRYNSYKSSPLNYEDPKADAWDAIVLEVLERQFAEKYDLLPSSDETKEYTKNIRLAYESDDDGRALLESYLSGMDMSSDEYWEYHERFLAPIALTHYNVETYIKENNMPVINIEDANQTISDMEYYDSLE